MTQSQQVFLKILKSAIHPSAQAEPLESSADWKAVLGVAVRQNLLPLVYNEAGRYEGFNDFAEKQGGKYLEFVMRAVGNQMRRTSELLRLYPAFLKAGVEPIVLKGIICRSLYGENADYRPSSDEDLWVEKENYYKAAKVLEQFGFRKKNPDADKDLNTVKDITYKNADSGFSIELHVNPFGFGNRFLPQIAKWFENAFESTEWVELSGVKFRTMQKTDNLLFLIFHAFKHFVYVGFGVRMITDILLYIERFFLEVDWDHIKSALENIGATGFFGDIIAIGNKYLGFGLPQVVRTVCPEELLEDVFRAGTFGNADYANSMSYIFTKEVVADGGKQIKGKSSNMIRLLFPDWETWKILRPHLAEKPYLLPAEWVKRIFKYFKRRKKGEVNLSGSYDIGRRRIELFEKYGIL